MRGRRRGVLMRRRGALRRLGRILLIAVILVWSAFPIYWALNTSFTTLNGAQTVPAHFVPSPFTAHNYKTLLNPPPAVSATSSGARF